MTYCLNIRLSESVYELFCVDCRKSLGTFNGSGMLAAMRHPASIGGVKCPECREMTCTNCGALQLEKPPIRGLCFFCRERLDASGLERAVSYGETIRAAAPLLSSSSNLHADSQKEVGHD
jgi:hypothetical protein